MNKQILTIRDNAKSELLSLKTIEDGIIQVNKLKGIETWVKAQKLDAELQVIVMEQQLRTKRIVGELLKRGQDEGEIATREDNLKQTEVPDSDFGEKKRLSDLGLSKKQSSEFKKIASIPEEVFEEHIAGAKAEVETAVKKLTTTGAVKLAESLKPEILQASKKRFERDEYEAKVKELLSEINVLPALYRLKVKQGIK